jgi:hypothetical protein
MATLQERLIETMAKDYENIKEFDDGKTLRKERSLLLKRIESAKKLFFTDKNLAGQLIEIENKTLAL